MNTSETHDASKFEELCEREQRDVRGGYLEQDNVFRLKTASTGPLRYAGGSENGIIPVLIGL